MRRLEVLCRSLLMLSIVWLGACAPVQTSSVGSGNVRVDLVEVLGKHGDLLVENTREQLQTTQPVLAASFVDVDNMGSTSTFGRQVAELLSGGLTRGGYPVLEVKLRNSLFIKENTGELMLSRELHHLSSAHDAQAVLVGTYARGGSYVYVNARIVRTQDSVILGSQNFRLPLNRDINEMLP